MSSTACGFVIMSALGSELKGEYFLQMLSSGLEHVEHEFSRSGHLDERLLQLGLRSGNLQSRLT